MNPNTVSTVDVRVHSHSNNMGGRSWDINNPLTRLKVVAASCFFGEPSYYAGTRSKPAKASFSYGTKYKPTLTPLYNVTVPHNLLLEQTIDEALAFDPEGTLAFAAELRGDLGIRTTPQVIMVRAAHAVTVRGTGLVRKYAQSILRRGDEPATQLAYHWASYGDTTPIPNALKKAWSKFLSTQSEYSLSKYRGESRAVKTVDVVNLVHAKSPAISALVNNTLRVTVTTWEGIVSTNGSSPQAWAQAFDVMPHGALLRNLNNLLTKSQVSEDEIITKLLSSSATSKELPFKYWAALQALGSTASKKMTAAIEVAMTQAVGALPQLHGKVACLVDNSGSAHGAFTAENARTTVAEIGNLTGVITALAAEEGWVGVFGDRLQMFKADKKKTIVNNLAPITASGKSIGGGTEHGIWVFWDRAIKDREHWDSVFVYSDMQAGHAGLFGRGVPSVDCAHGQYIDVLKMIDRYRSTVNKNVKVFLVQTAGYGDSLVPEAYRDTYVLGGWSPQIIRYASFVGA